MPRLPRPISDGFVYHAINRGNNRGPVFLDADDHKSFLEALDRTRQRYPFRLYGYCLMSNHFHLLLKPGEGQSISRILQSVSVAHTWRYHKRHSSSGHVWQGRFKSPVIQDGAHMITVLKYIEANPLRARIVDDLSAYPWSSYPAHAYGRPDPLLDRLPEYESLGHTASERQIQWRRRLESLQSESELAALRDSVKSGKPIGDPDWVRSHAHSLGIELNPRPRGRPKKLEK